MTVNWKNVALFGGVAVLILGTGVVQSWNSALFILNMGLISAIMSLGVNMQWGYAGLFNVGIMGFVALGGLATVLTSMPPTPGAWQTGGLRVVVALATGAATIGAAVLLYKRMTPGRARNWAIVALLAGGFFLYRYLFDPPVEAI